LMQTNSGALKPTKDLRYRLMHGSLIWSLPTKLLSGCAVD
jgi:hypothetical protein